VPFDQIRSEAANARITFCKIHSSVTESGFIDGMSRYAHCTGDRRTFFSHLATCLSARRARQDISYRRHQPFTLANTMAFVLNKLKLTGTGYQPKEEKAIHEVISWGRLPGHNQTVE